MCSLSQRQRGVVTAVTFAGRRVGPGQPCFIIAEAGVNHNGEVTRAKRLVDAARAAGADAVKFQTFKAERLAAPAAPKAAYQRKATPRGESHVAMLRRLELSEEAHGQVASHCRAQGILFLSTPFEEVSADMLDRLGLPAFKIASGDLTNGPLLAHVARKGKPMIVSTGMATLQEVDAAVRTIRSCGLRQIILLHCVSRYPADVAEANVRAMDVMRRTWRLPIGYSDHTLGIEVALAAVARGACVIEKHLTLDRSLPGPDHAASLDPREFAALVRGIRIVEAALGHGRKQPAPSEVETAVVARKSLVAAVPLQTGSRLTAEQIVIQRPGTGLPPAMLPHVVGRIVATRVDAGTVLTKQMLR
jgi:N-acetylneuraminate synthase